MKPLFVDTAGWMAMADGRDSFHQAAKSARDHWLEKGGRLVTSNFVKDETLTLIRMRLGLPAAERWWRMVSQSPRCQIVRITSAHEEKAAEWFFQWRDQAFSFTDCTSFVVMRESQLSRALTTDRHFLIAGFEILPQDALKPRPSR